MKKIAALLAVAGMSSSAFATNGMNLEGYGPIATAMGGASMAYDNGAAATMNNPATLALMPTGSHRLDLALGGLFPKATAGTPVTGTVNSGGDAYYMPAIGWIKKTGKWAYGVGVFAQGGMGTEYDTNSFMAAGSGTATRSEVGVGRVIFPLAYEASSDFTVGGSIDFVWASMDVRMALPGTQLGALVTGGSGGIAAAAAGLAAFPGWTRIDFSNTNPVTGEAKGTGWAGKLGFTYKASDRLTIGGAYHSKTTLSDLETGSQGATLSAANGFTDTGKIKVRNFQWPETYAIGLAYQASPQWLFVADAKHIGWADVMKNFSMTYESSGMGGSVSFALPQNWTNQTALELGAAYKFSDAMTLRFGGNFAKNPIPDAFVNPLFPAIIKNHYTFGLGYAFSKASSMDVNYVYAPKVSATNAAGVTSTLGGQSLQLMYSYRY